MSELLTLNAFTNGFHGLLSTTGIGTPEHIRWVYSQNPFDGITVFEDSWMFEPDTEKVRSRVRLGWLVEARALYPEKYAQAWEARTQFDYILTYDEYLLALEPERFKLAIRGGISIPQQNWEIRPKSRNVAMIATHNKYATPGHCFRHMIAKMFEGRIDVFGQTEWANKIEVLSDYRFVVVIEPERANNLFSEHLLDTIALGCIPIYWGAPNIGEYLDEGGLIPFQTVDELEGILHRLENANIDEYIWKKESLKKNFARLPEYRLAEDWLYEHFLGELI